MSKVRSLLIVPLLMLMLSGFATAGTDANSQVQSLQPAAVGKEVSYRDRALQEMTGRNYPAAIADFDQAIAKEPKNFLLYAYRATAFFNMNKFPEAAADLTKSIELNPRFAQTYFNRGIVRTSQMEFQSAIDDYSKGIFLSGDLVYVYKRATLYLWTKQYAKAQKDFDRVIAARPTFPEPYNDRGQLYMAMGETDKAIADYSTAVRLKPRFAEAYVNRSEAYQKAGKIELAKADRSKACEVGDEGMCEELASEKARLKQANKQ